MAAIDKTYLYRWEDYVKLRDWCKSVGTIVDDYGNTLTPLNWLWENDEDNFNEVITRQIKDCEERYQRGECKYLVVEGYITQEEYDNWDVMKHIWGIPVWNTSTELDVWLIRNCPLDFIQERLREQYGGGWSKEVFTSHNDDNMYDQIKNHTSPYDTYERNGLGKNIRVNKKVFPIYLRNNRRWTELDVSVKFPDGSYGWYKEKNDYWKSDDELANSGGNGCSHCMIKGNPKFKTLYRRLQKWDLPKGTVVTFDFWATHKTVGYRYHDRFKVVIKERRKR